MVRLVVKKENKLQKIIDYLCEQYSVPSIPVFIEKDEDMGINWAY
ncbi:unnamed protein product, partial [marine sediment metagenome]